MPLHQSALTLEFLTADMFGQSIRLSDFKGRPVMLSFMRYASCPLCNLRVREMVLAHERLANEGLVILVVFQSRAESMREYVGRHDSPFALIPDPDMRLYRLYGVEQSWAGLLSSANLLHAFRAFFRGFLSRKGGWPHRQDARRLSHWHGRTH